VKEILRRPLNLVRSSIIGTLVGILPGAGSPVASPLAYNEAKRWSRHKSEFGKGNMDGVVASEAAGNAAAGGAMVPTLGLGVPGSAPAAVILGSLMLHGVRPGPQLFQTQPQLVYAFAWAIVAAGIVTFILGSLLAGGLARMVSIPNRLLAPIVLFLSVAGSYAVRNSIVDVFLMMGLGILVYFLSKLGFHAAPIGLGIILGPIVEPALVQALAVAQAKTVAEVFFSGTVNIVVIVLTIASVAWLLFANRKEGRERRNFAD
jgi:putative tricarboxylic transport membrane protein